MNHSADWCPTPYIRFADGDDGSRPSRHHEGDETRGHQDDDDLGVPRKEPHKGSGGEAKWDPPASSYAPKNESTTTSCLYKLSKRGGSQSLNTLG